MATYESVSGADTPNTGRVKWNAADTAINAEVVAATAAIAAHKAAGNTDHDGRYAKTTDLNTHKSSTDHDSRYYTETEIDAMAVKLTGAQEVAGQKTLTSDLIVKKASPAVELQDAAGNRLAKIVGSSASDNSALIQVYDTSGGQFVTVLKVQTNGDITDSTGSKLATKDWVSARVRSGFFFVPLQRYIAAVAASTTYKFTDPNGRDAMIPIPNGGILKKSQIRVKMGSNIVDDTYDTTSVAFTETGYQWLTARLVTSGDLNGMTVQIYACYSSGGATIVETKVVEFAATYVSFSGALDIMLCLEFSI